MIFGKDFVWLVSDRTTKEWMKQDLQLQKAVSHYCTNGKAEDIRQKTCSWMKN